MKHTILIATIVVSCLVGGCSSGGKAQPDPVDARIAELHRRFFDPPESYADVKVAKRLVRDIIAIAAEGDKGYRGRVAEKLIGLLERNDAFVGYDYYILWLAGPLLTECLPSRDKAIASLVLKIDNRKRSAFDDEEIIIFAFEYLKKWTDYPGKSRTNLIGSNEGSAGSVDWYHWDEFRQWYRQRRSNKRMHQTPKGAGDP